MLSLLNWIDTHAHLENMFLFWSDSAVPGDQEPLLRDLIDVRVIGCWTEGEADHGIETLPMFQRNNR